MPVRTELLYGEWLRRARRKSAYHLYQAYPKLGIRSRGELAALGMVSA